MEEEEFSVRELADFREYLEVGNEASIEELVANNLAISDMRSYDLRQDFTDVTNSNLKLSSLVHDAAVELYRGNPDEPEQEEAFEYMASSINDRIEQEEGLPQHIIWGEVNGTPVNEVVEALAGYYAENFEHASGVETEKVIENQGFKGRADILREVNGETELRDIKTRYSSQPWIDRFKMGAYALISRGELEVDRFVLEYPVQGEEVEVEPEDWFADVANTAEDLRQRLDETRARQAELIQSDFPVDTESSPREFVESLNLPYRLNRGYAQKAVSANR